MIVKEFLEEIERLRKELPDIDNMEIGTVFHNNGDVIMNVVDLTIVGDSIGIIWMC